MKRSVNDITNCTNMNLRKATRLVTQAYDAALQSAGLKATQFTLLATLRGLGNPPLTKLAEAMVMDRTTLTRNLKPLIDKGLIRIATEQDQRIRQIQLTPQGKRLLDEALPQWQHIQNRVVERMGEERWAQFLEDLELTIEVMKATK